MRPYMHTLCEFWQRDLSCPNGLGCGQAHGEEEITAYAAMQGELDELRRVEYARTKLAFLDRKEADGSITEVQKRELAELKRVAESLPPPPAPSIPGLSALQQAMLAFLERQERQTTITEEQKRKLSELREAAKQAVALPPGA